MSCPSGASLWSETLESEALLLGRVTYDAFAAAWPSMTGEFAERISTMPKYVVSSTLRDPEWHNTQVVHAPLTDVAARLHEEVTADTVLHGIIDVDDPPGPYLGLAPAYHALTDWMISHGYQADGSPRELYLNDPREVDEQRLLTRVEWPLR